MVGNTQSNICYSLESPLLVIMVGRITILLSNIVQPCLAREDQQVSTKPPGRHVAWAPVYDS